MSVIKQAWLGTIVSMMLVVFLLMGCEPVGTKTTIGGLGGAAAGGLLGAALGGSGTGIAAGTILDKANVAAARALESVPAGQSVAWRNPDSGNAGVVTPMRTYQTANGQYCREYTQTINVGGEKHQSYGTACRQADGTWRIVS
jgi:surface antigen